MRKSALTPKRRMGPAVPKGPPPSIHNAKRELPDEKITNIPGGPTTRHVRTLRSQAPNAQAQKPKAIGLPDQARAEKGMSLALILRKQPKYILNSAEDVVVRTLTPRTTKGGLPAFIGTARDLQTKPMRVHKFQVIGLNKEKSRITSQKKIKVSCSCEFFTFYSEYALWTWGAANIRFSNGDPAVVRNPGNHPIVCKHLAQVLDSIRQHNL